MSQGRLFGERCQRLLGKIGVAKDKACYIQGTSQGTRPQSARREHVIEIHVRECYDEVAVRFQYGRIARRCPVEEHNGAVVDTCIACGIRDLFSGAVAAAWGDQPDAVTETGEASGCVQPAAARLFDPVAGIAGPHGRGADDPAPTIHVRATDDENIASHDGVRFIISDGESLMPFEAGHAYCIRAMHRFAGDLDET